AAPALALAVDAAEKQTEPAASASKGRSATAAAAAAAATTTPATTTTTPTTAAAAAEPVPATTKRRTAGIKKSTITKPIRSRSGSKRGEGKRSIPSEERAATIETTTGQPTITLPVSGREKAKPGTVG